MNEQKVLHEFAVAQKRGNSVTRFLRLIRFSHTIFALPFALAALVVSAKGRPNIKILLLVLGCMITARTAATLFKRFAEWQIDQRKPQTQSQHRLANKSTILVSLGLLSGHFIDSA